MAYLQSEQRDNALRAFSKALELDKNSPEANQGMALVHQLNGETKEAEARFKKALKLQKSDGGAPVMFNYARFLQSQNRCVEANKYFEKASQDFTYSGRAMALYYKGLCEESLGNPKKAVASYEYALNLNRNFALAAIELADKKFVEQDYTAAKRYLDIYSRNSRQSARSLWLGIQIERIFGNKDKEASYALALKNLHPYSKEYLNYKQLTEAQR